MKYLRYFEAFNHDLMYDNGYMARTWRYNNANPAIELEENYEESYQIHPIKNNLEKLKERFPVLKGENCGILVKIVSELLNHHNFLLVFHKDYNHPVYFYLKTGDKYFDREGLHDYEGIKKKFNKEPYYFVDAERNTFMNYYNKEQKGIYCQQFKDGNKYNKIKNEIEDLVKQD